MSASVCKFKLQAASVIDDIQLQIWIVWFEIRVLDMNNFSKKCLVDSTIPCKPHL
jgi:hypothetical protein